MYTAFYGLREKPFALVPDPRYLFLAASHREGLAHLLYGIDQSEGFIAVTGEVGTGKTTICRTLLERLGSETEVAFLFNPSRSGVELLQDISSEFGLNAAGLSRSELGAQLNRFLLEKKQEKRRVLLIIDEAQNLSPDTLEQVRLLSNLETSSQKLIQILLLGQPELDRKLDSPELRQLRQRISVRWALHPLTASETRAYVRHRLQVAAGVERDLFSDGALREIHRRTQGIPRLVNVLCDRVLLAGYVARASRIGVSIVKQAAREIPDAQRPSLWSRADGVKQAVRKMAEGVGAGAVFGSGLVLGLAVAAGVFVGSTDLLRERIEPLFLGREPVPADLSASVEKPVSSPMPVVTIAVESPEQRSSSSELAESPFEALDEVDVSSEENLASILFARKEAVTRQEAMNAVLRSFGFEAVDAVPRTDEIAVAWLVEQGLSTIALLDADFATLRSLDHPSLLRLRAESTDDARIVALLGLDDDLASVHGAFGAEPSWVPIDDVLDQWEGEAWVVWNDFESIRPVLALGEQGDSVAWLQEALARLGYYRSGVTGLFDRVTHESLRDFQRSHGLEPDGMAGPRTRMALYAALEEYPVPHLGRAGGG